MTQHRVVLHLDMDAFYASVEQRDRPELAGKPVIIGADPQGGQGRGVVAAASYEARAYGVRSAMPISRAWRACPTGVYLAPRHRYYSHVSRGIFGAVEQAVDVLEQVSIDEAYADVTERCRASFGQAREHAQALKDLVLEGSELTCSIGVAPNKLVAKIASDLDKPDGLTVVPPDQVAATIGPLSASVIPGVGPKTYQTLREDGIETVAELARCAPGEMAARFGSWGPTMVARAQGLDERPVDPAWDRKSVGAETTFREDLEPAEARAHLSGVVDEAVGRLAREGEQARTISLKVRLESFETFTRARTLPAATDQRDVVQRVVEALYDGAPVDEPVRLLGVRLSGLVREGPEQTSLEAWPATELGEGPGAMPPGWGRTWRF